MRSASAVALVLLVSACRTPAGFHGSVATPTGRVHVRSSGSGPDLVLLHGLGDSGIGWHKVECQLRAAGYRVTVWDALGAGASDLPVDGDYRIAAHADRLRAVFDHLDLQRVVLIGNSLGGTLALMAAQAEPERVAALVLVDPAGYRDGLTAWRWIWQVPLLDRTLELVPPAWVAAIGLRTNFGDPTRITDGDRRLYALLASRPGARRAFVLQERQLLPEEAAAREFAAGHKAIRCPTLILWGEQDRILPAVQGERLAADIPGARRVVLPGVGHAAQLEAPERFLEHVLPFLRAVLLVPAGAGTKPRTSGPAGGPTPEVPAAACAAGATVGT